jgi:hypothetical protein
MGWWKMDPLTGGINIDEKPTGHPGDHALINAIPGRDSVEDYYGGDDPADTFGQYLGIMRQWFAKNTKPKFAEILGAFTSKEFSPAFLTVPQRDLLRLVEGARAHVNACYLRQWERNMYDEEWVGVITFCCRMLDEPDHAEYWLVRPYDLEAMRAFNQGELDADKAG